MKKPLAIFLISFLLSQGALAVRAMPFYDKNKLYGWGDDTLSCSLNFHSVCWSGVVNVVEPNDITVLEQRMMTNLEATKIQLAQSQSDNSRALINSDELKEAMRALIREEFEKLKNK